METDDNATDLVVGVGRNDLHAGAGGVCPKCGREIEANQAVRRRISGDYQHDSC